MQDNEQQPFQIRDKVRVWKYDEETGKGTVIKRGVVVGLTTKFVQVFNPQYRKDDEYDTTPDKAEWFAADSKLIKTELRT